MGKDGRGKGGKHRFGKGYSDASWHAWSGMPPKLNYSQHVHGDISAGGVSPPLPVGPVPSVAAAEARQLSELSNKAGDKLAAQRYDLMAKNLEAADKPPPELSAHAQMQKAHKEVQQLESRAEKGPTAPHEG
eukprot:5623148-Pyramimonas_sp.AAC.1